QAEDGIRGLHVTGVQTCALPILPVEIQQESMGKAWFAKGGRSGWWRRLTFDLPSPTLVTMPNHASTSLCHPIECRALSLREYARSEERRVGKGGRCGCEREHEE